MNKWKEPVLIDVYVRIDVHNYYQLNNPSGRNMALSDAKYVEDLLKDHKSLNPFEFRVEREYETQCRFCHRLAEEMDETGLPACCDAAQEAFKTASTQDQHE